MAALVVLAVFTAAGGRPPYALACCPFSGAASATELAAGRAARWWRWTTRWPMLAVSGVFAVLVALPVLPVQTVDRRDPLLTAPGTTGWPGLADAVAEAAHPAP